MPKYGISTFGRQYVIDEELPELPQTRLIFIGVTFILGFGALVKYLVHLHSITSRRDRTCSYFPLNSSARRIIACYVISHLIHTVHFIDNIYRPVDYFEPRWLYDRVFISEMEITFFANFPITLSGLIFMERFTTAVAKRHLKKSMESCKKMGWYIFGSFLTLGHYRTEPPWNYSLSTTFTIAGEGVAGMILAVSLYRYFKFAQEKMKIVGKEGMEQGCGEEEETEKEKNI